VRRKDKLVLWRQGARFCLRVLRYSEDPKERAQEMVDMPGMTRCVYDDFWAMGFVAMAARRAGVVVVIKKERL